MFIAEYTLIMLVCSSGLGLFGFFLGRCARKLPILDDHLPWTMSAEHGLPGEDSQSQSAEPKL
jgi:hypothetical protein